MPVAKVHRIPAAGPDDASGIAAAIEADTDDAADVHFVRIKCPLLMAQHIKTARTGHTVATTDTLKSMGLSRAASALGFAVALDEIAIDALHDDAIGANTDLWSGRASCSAGIELVDHEVLVLGMSTRWSGPLTIDHAVMHDGIDVQGPDDGGPVALIVDRGAISR